MFFIAYAGVSRGLLVMSCFYLLLRCFYLLVGQKLECVVVTVNMSNFSSVTFYGGPRVFYPLHFGAPWFILQDFMYLKSWVQLLLIGS